MDKKTKTGGKRSKLRLGKETVASLTSDMLKAVAGGALPECPSKNWGSCSG